MTADRPSLLLLYGEPLLVTFLWSTSYVLIKVGLSEVSPFLFAAVRYALAFAVLGLVDIGLARKSEQKTAHGHTMMVLLAIAGICGYTLAQGFQFLGLFYLPAVTTSFLFNFTPIFVLILGLLVLHEKASWLQLVGLAVALAGAFAFFSERLSWKGEQLGVLIVIIGGIAWAIYMVIMRKIQRVSNFGSLRLTLVTMGIGTVGLLAIAIVSEGFKPISLNALVIILWLSVVNTAMAFLMWNHALKFTRPYELSVIQNSMLVQIAILAWLFLGESLTLVMVAGVVFVITGILLVQIPAIKRTDVQLNSRGFSP
jgi:drug/metabolite transporter (DMT)-like permease